MFCGSLLLHKKQGVLFNTHLAKITQYFKQVDNKAWENDAPSVQLVLGVKQGNSNLYNSCILKLTNFLFRKLVLTVFI